MMVVRTQVLSLSTILPRNLFHLSLTGRQLVVPRNQLSNAIDCQSNAKSIDIFVVGSFLPGENGSASLHVSLFQFIDLKKIEKRSANTVSQFMTRYVESSNSGARKTLNTENSITRMPRA